MDLTQKKLSKSEWLNIEVPFPESEKKILQLIIDGYNNVNISVNNSLSLIHVMKLEVCATGIHEYFYKTYFEELIKKTIEKYPMQEFKYESPNEAKKILLKKAHIMRINNMNSRLEGKKGIIIEYILIDNITLLFKYMHNSSDKYAFYLYTIIQIRKAHISDVNKYVLDFIDKIIALVLPKVKMQDVINQAYIFIEKNPSILKYQDITLYQHQKDIYKTFHYATPNEYDEKTNKLVGQSTISPRVVLYTAPTGTGKTLTPLGLSEGFRIIFICAARHVGLALAKSAVCLGKRIAIAFGCETADDIRLHYYAASEYSVNKRSGGIGKVDNTVGDKVEIMICDIKSYLIAMQYMMAFSPNHCVNEEIDENIAEIDSMMEDSEEKEKLLYKKSVLNNQRVQIEKDCDIITYWDEPTISMDYDEHPLHDLIQKTWRENKISKLVLSCATLPKQHEIGEALQSFQMKFPNSIVVDISSFDCKKSISLLDETCKSVVPHLLYEQYDELQKCVRHCMDNKSLLRYFDLQEIIKFINKIHQTNSVDSHLKMESYFEDGIKDITMNSLKQYYLHLLKHVSSEKWPTIYSDLISVQKSKFEHINKIQRTQSLQEKSTMGGGPLMRIQSVQTMSNGSIKGPKNILGLNITTTDAHTLTDGPTIYLTDNVENLGKFYLMQSNIPERVFQSIYQRVESNTVIQKQLTELENKLEHLQEMSTNAVEKGQGKKSDKKMNDKKMNRDDEKQSPEIRKISQQIESLRMQIVMVNMDDVYIPNTQSHQRTWTGDFQPAPYSPNIDEDDVCKIMALDVDNNKKILLLLGIGVFTDENTANPRYMEIMKKLAYEQRLYLILASSDYIYGTNYQFTHGYIGKDLSQMTQQKTIQALGRIGRNNMQQEYTIRFRDNAMLHQLFTKPEENKESILMNRLFTC